LNQKITQNGASPSKNPYFKQNRVFIPYILPARGIWAFNLSLQSSVLNRGIVGEILSHSEPVVGLIFDIGLWRWLLNRTLIASLGGVRFTWTQNLFGAGKAFELLSLNRSNNRIHQVFGQ